MLTRVQRLPAGARDLLETVSVEPGSIGRGLLRALGTEDRAVDDALRAAVLVDDGRGLRFRHELARIAVEASLPPERTRELHRRLLEALEADAGTDPARLAHHAAAVGDRDVQLRWSRAAAEAAMSASAHREAVEHYSDAAEHLDLLPAADASSVLAGYGEALVAVDQPARAVEAWERAAELLERGDDEVALCPRERSSRAPSGRRAARPRPMPSSTRPSRHWRLRSVQRVTDASRKHSLSPRTSQCLPADRPTRWPGRDELSTLPRHSTG